MNALSIAGGFGALAGVLLLHVRDWSQPRRRLVRWLWYPVTAVSVLALLASRSGVTHIIATLIVAMLGGTLLAVAFISQKTGQDWLAVMEEMLRRQDKRKRRQP